MISVRLNPSSVFKYTMLSISLLVGLLPQVLSKQIPNSSDPRGDSIQVVELLDRSKAELSKDYKKGIELAKEAKLLAEQGTDQGLIMQSTLNLGTLYFNLGLYDKATDFFTEILQIATKNQDDEWMGKGYYQLGVIRLVMEDYELAKNHFLKAKKFFLKKHKSFDQISLNIKLGFHNNFGVVYLGLGELELAKSEIEAGIALLDEREEFIIVSTQLFNNLGDVYFKLGDSAAAFESYFKAKDQLRLMDQAQLEAMVNISLGKIFMAQGDLEEALIYFHEGFVLANSFQGYSHLKHISTNLSELYEQLGQRDSAFIYLQLSKAYQDSLNLKKTTEKVLQEEMLIAFSEEKSQLKRFYDRNKAVFYVVIIFLIAALLIGMNRVILIKKNLKHVESKKNNFQNLAVQVQHENTELKLEVEQTKKDMTLKAMQAIQKEGTLKQLAETLTKSNHSGKEVHQQELERLLDELKIDQSGNALSDFELRFGSLYVGFFEKLMEEFPNLSLNDRRLSAFLKLQLTTKEIAAITGQSIRAVELGRIRLRKKIALTNSNKSLNEFFLDY